MRKPFKIALYCAGAAAALAFNMVMYNPDLVPWTWQHHFQSIWQQYQRPRDLSSRDEAFYKERGIRQAKTGEYVIRIFRLEEFSPPTTLSGDNNFYWLDENTIAYGPKSDTNPTSINKSYITFNFKTLKRNQISELPIINQGPVLPLTKEIIEKNRTAILEKNLYTGHVQGSHFLNPTMRGFLFSGGETKDFLDGDLLAGHYVAYLGFGLDIVTPDEIIEVLKGNISHLKSSPDGCRAIFLWRKGRLFEDRNNRSDSQFQLGLLDICAKNIHGEE